MAKKAWDSIKFDMAAARQMADTFAFSSGIHCALHSESGECIYQQGEKENDCSFCRRLSDLTGKSYDCKELHTYGAAQSERFGGRYIYFCPLGLAFTASPIITGGRFAGALIGGPVLIMEPEDLLASDAFQRGDYSPELREQMRAALAAVPRLEPRRLHYLSGQIFADALYISDSSHELFASMDENRQQNFIGSYISQLKSSEESSHYPMEKEEELFSAVSRGDKTSANEKLNQLLGHIFFYISDPAEIRARVQELFVILTRAAAHGGANVDHVLNLSQKHMQELQRLNTQAEITRWLAKSLNRFTELVFNMVDLKHINAITDAVDYMKERFSGPITLGDVAQHVGYSSTYFSKIFKEEIGVSFKEYLNELRVEKSKALLLSEDASISDICSIVGFNDQSYFCKTFKSIVGVTPDKFRKRVRRIDAEKEYGRK